MEETVTPGRQSFACAVLPLAAQFRRCTVWKRTLVHPFLLMRFRPPRILRQLQNQKTRPAAATSNSIISVGMPDQYLLQWSDHTSNITSAFAALRRHNKLVDVTLAAEGRHIQAHKVVLCANSPYFEELLGANPCQHPIVYMKDVQFDNLSALVDFMYTGLVYVSRSQLSDVIKVGSSLQVRGIAGVSFPGPDDDVEEEPAPAVFTIEEDHHQTSPAVALKKRKHSFDASATPCQQGAPGVEQMVIDESEGADVSMTSIQLSATTEQAVGSTALPCQRVTATVPTAAERKAILPRSFSTDNDSIDRDTVGRSAGEASQRSRRGRFLQRQPRVKRDADHLSPMIDEDNPGDSPRSPSPTMLAASVETVLSDAPSIYLTVPASVSSRQMSLPSPSGSRVASSGLLKQGSTPTSAAHQQLLVPASCSQTPSSHPTLLPKQLSTPQLQRAASTGPTFYMLATGSGGGGSTLGGSSTTMVPVVLTTQQQPTTSAAPASNTLPQIMLTAADESTSLQLSGTGSGTGTMSVPVPAARSHTPMLRDGPAVSCSHCWNTEYSQGRTIRRKTKYMCRDCSTSLCIVPCFQEYHELGKSAGVTSPTLGYRDSGRQKKILPKIESI